MNTFGSITRIRRLLAHEPPLPHAEQVNAVLQWWAATQPQEASRTFTASRPAVSGVVAFESTQDRLLRLGRALALGAVAARQQSELRQAHRRAQTALVRTWLADLPGHSVSGLALAEVGAELTRLESRFAVFDRQYAQMIASCGLAPAPQHSRSYLSPQNDQEAV